MKKLFFAALAMTFLLGACKNENRTAAADNSTEPVASTEPVDPTKLEMFDSVAHAKEMIKRQKETEANLITPENFESKGQPGAIMVAGVATTSSEKNAALQSAVKAFLSSKGTTVETTNGSYGYNLVDLNGDGVKDALVYLVSTAFCNDEKCTLLVATGEAGDKFKVHSMIKGLSTPVLVSATTTKGWADIVTQLFDEKRTAISVKLTFDGSKYPDSPAASNVKPLEKAVKASGYLMNASTSGLNLAN
ncbi:MAG: hypothetical protein KF852_05775 [Saprospiraceae bacterium]|nr:hypothetical protein [Saprospiraceae bacterium]